MYKTKAIVINRKEKGEADRILEVLTEDFGRLSIMARGIRKVTSKLNAHTQLFNEAEIVFVDGRKNKVLTSASKLNGFPSITHNLKKIIKVNEAAVLSEKLVLRNNPDEKKIFHLFRDFISAVERNSEKDTELIMRYFEFGLLAALGFGPEFQKCVLCGRTGDDWRVALAQGGRLCGDCFQREKNDAVGISKEARFLAEALAAGKRPIDEINNEVIAEIGRLLRLFMSYHTNN